MTARRAASPRQPWLWSWLGALAVWLGIVAFTRGQGGGEVLTAALTFATFYVLVALGQMFVVTLGPGNVDLSIPACMTLAGTVAMKVMDEADALILPGLAVALAIGLGVGAANYALIRFLRIPPIIATLSLELRLPVGGDLVQPRPAHQAAAGARRLHHRHGRRRAGAGARACSL